MDNYYAIKDAGKLTIEGKDYKVSIDTANEIHTINARNNTNIIIVSSQLTSDELEEKLKDVRGSEIKLELKCKSFSTGEYIFKERLFKNMSFIKQEVRYDYDRPSDIILVFANKPYFEVKEVLNEYLSRNNIIDCSRDIGSNISSIAEELNYINSKIGSLKNDIAKIVENNTKKDKN